MKKILFLILAFLLIFSTGCPKKEKQAHLNASIQSYEYNSSTGFIEIFFRVVNDGERDVDYYEIFYRISFDSQTHDDWTNGSNLKTGQTRTEYDISFIGSGKTIKSVSISEVEWKVY